MPGIDTSMYGQQQPIGVVNPLDMFGKALGIQNALMQNRVLAAKASAGQAIMNARDPATGLTVASKLQTNDPYAAEDVAGFAMDTAQKQFALKQAQSNTAIQSLGDLATTQAPVSYSDFVGRMTQQLSLGLMDPNEYSALVKGAPTDPAGLKSYVQGLYSRTLSPDSLANSVPTGVVPDGQPNAGAPVQGTPIDRLKLQTGNGQSAAPQDGDVGSGGADLSFALPQGSQGAPAAPQGGGGATPVAGGPPGVVMGMPPGQSEAMTKTAGISADLAGNLTRTADQVPARKAAYDNMLADLNQFDSAPGSDWRRAAAALANHMSPFGPAFDEKGVAAQENFGKLAKTLVSQQSQAMGGTDLDTMTASGANPGTDFSKLGNQQIIGILKGNEDSIAAKNEAWQNWQAQGHPPQSYGQFQTSFNQIFDPRVFQSKYMNAQQKSDMISSMNPAEKKEFTGKLKAAITMGWLPDPRAPNAGQ